MGEITWQNKNETSVIDFLLVNQRMYDRFISMKIDENNDKFDISDHMISTTFSIKCKKQKRHNETIAIRYLKIDNDTKDKILRQRKIYPPRHPK